MMVMNHEFIKHIFTILDLVVTAENKKFQIFQDGDVSDGSNYQQNNFIKNLTNFKNFTNVKTMKSEKEKICV